MSIISIIYPDILELIGQMERFHPRVALRWHMGRVFLLYFGNLAILMWERGNDYSPTVFEYFSDNFKKRSFFQMELMRDLVLIHINYGASWSFFARFLAKFFK